MGAPAHSSDSDYFPHIPGGGLFPYANRRPTSFWSSAVFLSTLGGGAAFGAAVLDVPGSFGVSSIGSTMTSWGSSRIGSLFNSKPGRPNKKLE